MTRATMTVATIVSTLLGASVAGAATTGTYLKIDNVRGEPEAAIAVSGWSFDDCRKGRCVTVASPAAASAPRAATPSSGAGGGAASAAYAATGRAPSDAQGEGGSQLDLIGTLSEVRRFTLSVDKSSPLLAQSCASGRLARAELQRGEETFQIVDATISCRSDADRGRRISPGSAVAQGASLLGGLTITIGSGKVITRTGHVTLMK